jgi:transposase InsO family protein
MAFLTTVIDCATRKVAGWAMDDNCRTPLITSAIEMAARNLNLPLMRSFIPAESFNATVKVERVVLGRADVGRWKVSPGAGRHDPAAGRLGNRANATSTARSGQPGCGRRPYGGGPQLCAAT